MFAVEPKCRVARTTIYLLYNCKATYNLRL
jgi:hypothetical protein